MSSVNFLFMGLVFLGPLISISSSNWIICWSGIELGFLGLIPLLFLGNKFMSLTKESSMKYFCVQALGSALLFYGGLMSFSGLFSSTNSLIFVVSLVIKLGIFPSHFWVPGVISGLSWISILLILTLQKIGLFAFLSLLIPCYEDWMVSLLMLLGVLSALTGAMLGLNQTDLRAMVGASSIAHSGWLLLGCMTGMLWTYFTIYCISMVFVVYFLWGGKSSAEAGVGLLSLSGLPPFVLFLGKWSLIKSALEVEFSLMFLGMFLLSALISLFFYLKFTYSFLLNSKFLPWIKGESVGLMVFMGMNLLFFTVFFVY